MFKSQNKTKLKSKLKNILSGVGRHNMGFLFVFDLDIEKCHTIIAYFMLYKIMV